jgi:hypothetical protein
MMNVASKREYLPDYLTVPTTLISDPFDSWQSTGHPGLQVAATRNRGPQLATLELEGRRHHPHQTLHFFLTRHSLRSFDIHHQPSFNPLSTTTLHHTPPTASCQSYYIPLLPFIVDSATVPARPFPHPEKPTGLHTYIPAFFPSYFGLDHLLLRASIFPQQEQHLFWPSHFPSFRQINSGGSLVPVLRPTRNDKHHEHLSSAHRLLRHTRVTQLA